MRRPGWNATACGERRPVLTPPGAPPLITGTVAPVACATLVLMPAGPDPLPPRAPPGAPASPPAARCVLWRPPGGDPPAELLESLRRRNLEIIDCTDPYTAMARLCLLQRETVAAVGAGRAVGPFILIVVAPTELPDAPDLVRAVERYAPRAACWMYESLDPASISGPSPNPRLRRIVPEDVQFWLRRSAESARPGSVPPTEGPRLRLAVGDDSPPESRGRQGGPDATATSGSRPPTLRRRTESLPASEDSARSASDAPAPLHAAGRSDRPARIHTVLTNEELAMLLADDVRQPPAGPAAPSTGRSRGSTTTAPPTGGPGGPGAAP